MACEPSSEDRHQTLYVHGGEHQDTRLHRGHRRVQGLERATEPSGGSWVWAYSLMGRNWLRKTKLDCPIEVPENVDAQLGPW